MLKDKVVIITGATSGIGQATAHEFGKAGAKIVITGRSRVKLDETLVSLQREGIDCLAVLADAASEQDNIRMAQEVMAQYGHIDILINNAGISMRALFEDLELSVFKQVIDVNFYGTVYATKYCLPYILASKGSVVAVSSINGYRGTPARTAYTASKYAINGFMESLRTEVMKRGVNVMVISPGFTTSNIRNNALTADGKSQGESPREESKMMSAEDVAKEIYSAVKRRKRQVVLTGEGKLAVFLNKWIPGIMDHVVYRHMAKEKDSPFK
nr:SDR family oxidoreductase [Penaeicola halotolerans]